MLVPASASTAARQLVATAAPGNLNDPASWRCSHPHPHVQALIDLAHDDPADPDAEPEPFRALLVAVTHYLRASGQTIAGRPLAEAAHRRWA